MWVVVLSALVVGWILSRLQADYKHAHRQPVGFTDANVTLHGMCGRAGDTSSLPIDMNLEAISPITTWSIIDAFATHHESCLLQAQACMSYVSTDDAQDVTDPSCPRRCESSILGSRACLDDACTRGSHRIHTLFTLYASRCECWSADASTFMGDCFIPQSDCRPRPGSGPAKQTCACGPAPLPSELNIILTHPTTIDWSAGFAAWNTLSPKHDTTRCFMNGWERFEEAMGQLIENTVVEALIQIQERVNGTGEPQTLYIPRVETTAHM
jgi:hypothetical protein